MQLNFNCVIHLSMALAETEYALEEERRLSNRSASSSLNSRTSFGKLAMTNTALNLLGDLDQFLDFEIDTESLRSFRSQGSARRASFDLIRGPNIPAGPEELHQIEEVIICDTCLQTPVPVMQAATSGHTLCLKYLLLREEDPVDLKNIRTPNGASAVHIAARRGDETSVLEMLSYEPRAAKLQDYRGASPTHVAAYNGREATLKSLLLYGGSAAQKSYDGASPAHYAASAGKLSCLKMLSQYGAGPNDRTHSGITPVYFAAQEGHLDCLRWLVRELGADANIKSADGMTPLHAAAQTGKLQCVHWLVTHGRSNVRSRTVDGATPMHFAAARGQVAVLEWLLNLLLTDGLERDDFGATPIHDAAEQGQLDCLRVFASWTIDFSIKDDDGLTPLDLAQQGEHAKCIKFIAGVLAGKSRVSQSNKGTFQRMNSRRDSLAGNNLKKEKRKKFKWPWKK